MRIRLNGAECDLRARRASGTAMTGAEIRWCRKKGFKVDKAGPDGAIWQLYAHDPLVGEFALRAGDVVNAVMVDGDWFDVRSQNDLDHVEGLVIEAEIAAEGGK